MSDSRPARSGILRALGFGAAAGSTSPAPGDLGLRRPAAGVPHVRARMSWPASRSIRGRRPTGVRRDIALIARTVVGRESVIVCTIDEDAAADARAHGGPGVPVVVEIPTDDLRMRRGRAVFRTDGAGRTAAVGLDVDGLGRAGFVGEGGAVETDGGGAVMDTESSLAGRNRDRAMSTMIRVPGIKGRDITDDRIDRTSRCVRPRVVTARVPPGGRRDARARDARGRLAILATATATATDAKRRRLRVVTSKGPKDTRSTNCDPVDSCLNLHPVGGGVVTARFRDRRTDAAARSALAGAFPGRVLVRLDVDRPTGVGGGMHCSTMRQPPA
ncbi:agmatine deiminase family protein [Embleya hyalina]|uniref:Porphyromonas-type peptidyl-arginine deiminase n=1 Tax=Embleya hyalina TaxID=516124 RepID=A0A401YNA4_9ACTN|nr:agmatine deiminase family protein [Embleya hyalina]GCD96085.1 Porphyromonas-type peptidyl-arginine deiminase [Embleya hyalina]